MLSLGFGPLLAAIYRDYPDMAVNGVAPEVVEPGRQSAVRFRTRRLLEHAAGAFDVTGASFDLPPGETGFRSDHDALAADWYAVGDDLRAALADFASGAGTGGAAHHPSESRRSTGIPRRGRGARRAAARRSGQQ